jgi:hypothetical protein
MVSAIEHVGSTSVPGLAAKPIIDLDVLLASAASFPETIRRLANLGYEIIKFWMDATSGVALALKTGLPTYQVEDEEGRTHLLIHLPIEEEDEDRFKCDTSYCLWARVQGDYFFAPRIAAFAAFAIRNLTTVLAGILIFSHVFGLFPVRAFRLIE